MLWPHLQHFQRNSSKPACKRKEWHIDNRKHGQVEANKLILGRNCRTSKGREKSRADLNGCMYLHTLEMSPTTPFACTATQNLLLFQVYSTSITPPYSFSIWWEVLGAQIFDVFTALLQRSSGIRWFVWGLVLICTTAQFGHHQCVWRFWVSRLSCYEVIQKPFRKWLQEKSWCGTLGKWFSRHGGDGLGLDLVISVGFSNLNSSLKIHTNRPLGFCKLCV